MGPETRVGICTRRGLSLPVGVLGILACAGAYVVLDPAHPRHRLDDICADAGIDVVVVDEAGSTLLAGTPRQLVVPLLAPLDLLTPLTCGSSVQLVPDADRVDPTRLQRFLEAHEVTWGFIPPALLPLLDPARLPTLRDVVTAGEPPGPEQVARWSDPPRRRLHNWYGPTETTVCVVGGELTGDWQRSVPIGRPLLGCRAYVLDDQMAPSPPEIPGELYIGGPQVARGYWRRPGLTAECPSRSSATPTSCRPPRCSTTTTVSTPASSACPSGRPRPVIRSIETRLPVH